MLYLELGCIPIRFLIKQRRLMFLHYLLQQDADSLLFKFLNSQIEEAVKGDWINYIYEDLKKLKITWSLEQIQSQSTNLLKSHVKEKTEKSALNWLN